ncbi:uncharacterized protein LOC124940289 [Impatiens glandulifera]|uniref:uncharacterized protein LOC124940289 n=1 Tax=Impatiens glandulifera TaxID=253017 RepID=UPI001FB09B75|nr:uncharacterized protein LOC124940289 [Impatiens glandulifera]
MASTSIASLQSLSFISNRNSTSKSGMIIKKRPLTMVAATGDVSSDSTVYLVAGAALVALVGTAFPILFSRKDTCPECDGAGFVRQSGGTLRANAARKDQTQIVCARCNGLGKLNQIDK